MNSPPLACAALAAAVFALGGCHADWVREHPLGCRADEQALARDTLYFGRAIGGGGAVDDNAWKSFEEAVLMPAFPRGYSVLDATGHWQRADGHALSEASRIVVIVHADDATAAATLRDVVARYRTMFHQESVLRERSAVCAEF